METLPIPIYILKKGEAVPQETCYLVTKDGVFLHKLNGLVESLVRVEGICFLESVKPKAILHLPKIPTVIMARALVFFRKIHEQMNSEANLMLHYRHQDGRKSYRFVCPIQKVSAASVEYQAEERLEGYQLVGTVHSHNRMSAFHSSVDKTDEFCFDGLHITIGSLNKFPEFSMTCSVVVNGQRFRTEPEEVISGIRRVESEADRPNLPRGFMGNITESLEQGLASILDPDPTSFGFYHRYAWMPPELYELILPGERDPGSVSFPPQWSKKVTKKTPISAQGGLRL